MRGTALRAALCILAALPPGCESAPTAGDGSAFEPGPHQLPSAQERLAEAESASRAGEYERALGLLRQILAENPTVTQAWLGIGDIQLGRGEYAAAEPAYARAARLEPRNYEAQYGHGLALQMLSRFVEAVKAYHRALTIQPESIEANLQLATTYLQMGEATSAVVFAEKAVELDPDNGAARVNLGAVYEGLGRYEQAITQYEAALELMEPTPPLLINLINVLAKEKRYLDAKNTAEYLVRIAPLANSYERLGWCCFRLGDYERSQAAYRQAVEIDPGHWPSLNGLGCNALNRWLLSDKRDAEAAMEAKRAFRQSLRANPNQPKVISLLLQYSVS